MSLMERRLQLLLDQHRYQLVAREAERTGRTVSAVIREAIDEKFDDDDEEQARIRRQAGEELLASMRASEHEPRYTPEELDAGHYGTDEVGSARESA